jgi:uncharacterized protein YegJ (DUF2314 family)
VIGNATVERFAGLLAGVAAGLVIVLAFGCSGNDDGGNSGSGDTNIVGVPGDDPGVAAAQAEAQRRWSEFAHSFAHRSPGTDYGIKVSFPTPDASHEHVWIKVESIKGRAITGTIANDPVAPIGHVYGDRVTVDRARAEDWLISQGSSIVEGGFSRGAVTGSDAK